MTELVEEGSYRVPCGAGNRGYDVSFNSKQSIRERRLADVRAPNDGEVRKFRMLVVVSGSICRQTTHDFVQKVSGAASVCGRYAPDFTEPERIELESVVNLLSGVHLIDCEYHWLSAAAQHVGNFRIVVCDSGGSLDHK